MKIVLVNKFWYPRGGAEKVALLTKELLEKSGHQVEIFGMNHPQNLFANEYFSDFIDYNSATWWQKIKFGLRAIYNFQAKHNFDKLLDDFRPDIVHFHNIYHQLSCSIIDSAKKRKIKTVMTLHDYKFISPNYNLFHHGKVSEECVGGRYYRCLFNNCMENRAESLLATIEAYFVDFVGYKKFIDKYLSPSQFLRRKFIAAGFPAERIEHLPNPLPENEFQFSSHDSGYVGYVGRLAVEKGINFLLEAAEKLSDIKFKIVGDGPQRIILEKIVADKKINNVEFLGEKHGQQLNDFIAGARLLVAPSVWHENAPMSVVEAKAHGKVIIASSTGGISEILPADFLVPASDATVLSKKIKEWFYANPVKLKEFGIELQIEAQLNNGADNYLKKLLEIYSDL
jgi:glycosyltransferase involved in cell wall biosynthesis